MIPAFVLVHGSCHGAWCWRDVLSCLQDRRQSARAIDLPGSGADPTPIAEVTLDSYAGSILDGIDAPVVLVGHSAGGYAITAAAERSPEKVAGLIYLCAYVPAPGKTLADLRRDGPRQPLKGAIVLAPDRLSYTVDPARAPELFYHDCPPEAVAFALSRLGPQAIRPQETVLPLTGCSASLPRHYIRCLDDRTIPPDYQAAMVADWPAASVSTLPMSHSPFFAAPWALADRLIAITGTGAGGKGFDPGGPPR